MKKNFISWNTLKIDIHHEVQFPKYHERDIWYLHLGQNVGHEQAGVGKKFLRPVIILKKFSKRLFLGIPLTSAKKADKKFYLEFTFKESMSTALLSQVRLFDARRLSHRMGRASGGDFRQIKEKLIELIR